MTRKRTLAACFISALPVTFLAASCSQEGVDTPAATTGGSTGTGGSSTATGGITGSGGSVTTGGTTGVGGSTGGTTTSSGGASGAPAATGGSSGSTASGGAATTGGGPAATGGTTTTGGTSGGGAPAGGSGGAVGGGGTAGSGGAGGSAPAVTITPELDGYLWVGKCSRDATGYDCEILNAQNQCPNSASSVPFAQRGVFLENTFTVGGVQGQKYFIEFEVRGVTAGKVYNGGMQRTATGHTNGMEGNDSWYVGGTPTDSLWNTYELHVDPPVPNEANVYYFNAYPQGIGYDGRHETFFAKFTAKFAVLGGGTLKLVIHDSNCRGQQNCGITGGQQADECTMHRTIDLSGMSPPPPSTFVQPYTLVDSMAREMYPQWLYWDVKSITPG